MTMANDYREVAKEIDRLVRVGYVGRDLLARLARTYPCLARTEFNEALQEAKAMAQDRLDAAGQKIAER
jgi:hypothetical protein